MRKCALTVTVVFMMIVLSCCGIGEGEKPTNSPYRYGWMSGASPISQQRTGISEQGVTSLANGFECTTSGVYYMLSTNNGTFLFYGDHGSDTIVKLCGRPECNHSDKDCNAYFEGGSNICYYNGSLYAVKRVDNKAPNVEVVKLNLDGSGRVSVVDTLSMSKEYSGNTCPRLWNGVFSVVMTRLDESGKEVGDAYYFKLDGSMDQLEPSAMLVPYANDGEVFLTFSVAQNGTSDIVRWDPDTNALSLVEKNLKELNTSYVGIECSYKIQDGVVYRYSDLLDEEEKLFDTGLDGEKALVCFPDCLVVRDHISWNSYLAGEELQQYDLHFYNWDYEFLGSVALNYPRDKTQAYLICGETPGRIILTDSDKLYPRYYIEKSDFGTENIAIHEYNLPDLTEELAELENQLAGG